MTITAWADFNHDRTHRYSLGRRWSAPIPDGADRDAPTLPAHKFLVVIGLNPSAADETFDDPTVTRCRVRAHAYGFGGLVMLNLFSLVSTDPRALRVSLEREGGEYHRAVLREWFASPSAGMVLAAWGSHSLAGDRARDVVRMVRQLHGPIYSLGETRSGAPRHPLYVPYQTRPQRWPEGLSVPETCAGGPLALPSPGTPLPEAQS